MYQVGKIDHDVLEDITELCCPTVGSCQHMATANSMCCMAEALGLSLPGSAAIPAVYNDRTRAALLSWRGSCPYGIKRHHLPGYPDS